MSKLNNLNTYAILMAGGAGTRLWPYSRKRHPKQFIDLLGQGHTLIQMTYARMLDFVPSDHIYVVTHKAHVDLVSEQLPDLPKSHILAEPLGRNTAPCIAYASYVIKKKVSDALLLVVPSDHVIQGETAFKKCIKAALKGAESKGRLITLGIKPTEPNTGFGYIQFYSQKNNIHNLHKVKIFTEKPNKELAEKFLESGEFAWNSGIFVWRLKSIFEAFETYLPEVLEAFKEGVSYYGTPKEATFLKKIYALVPNISIDYAIMEKHQEVYVVLCDFQWSDLGSWQAVYALHTQNGHENKFIGANGLSYDSQNNLICTKSNKLVIIEGLKGYVVADCEDVLLIYRKENEAGMRRIVRDIREKKGEKYL